MDYEVKMPDGCEVLMEASNSSMLEIDIDGLTGEELEMACLKLFSNLGWEVKRKAIVELEKRSFRPDLVLSRDGKEYGYVEIIASMEPSDLIKKQETVKVIIDEFKPELFVLTNGKVFDVFYNGKYDGTMSVAPSPEYIRQKHRLKAYAKMILELKKGNKKDD